MLAIFGKPLVAAATVTSISIGRFLNAIFRTYSFSSCGMGHPHPFHDTRNSAFGSHEVLRASLEIHHGCPRLSTCMIGSPLEKLMGSCRYSHRFLGRDGNPIANRGLIVDPGERSVSKAWFWLPSNLHPPINPKTAPQNDCP